VPIYLTDEKRKDPPAPSEAAPLNIPAPERATDQPRPVYTPPEPTPFDAMKDSLKAGIQTVSAPQLFPTPPEIAQKMFELAEIDPGMCVLEPSAGTGNLIEPIVKNVDTEILAYEINQKLCSILSNKFPSYRVQVRQADFLEVTDFQGQYPRIIMNPPFENGGDIKHIQHAMKFLAPGGRLVALCANGPRQQKAFKDDAEYWEDLPAGSFKEQGTSVNVAVMVLT
jgi:protein-L-isoaspartate O-methyltransferase